MKDSDEEKNKKGAPLSSEAYDDKCCITSHRDSHSRGSSRSQCSKSLKSMGNETTPSESLSPKPKGGRGPIMPEPLPLYDGEKQDEPSIMHGLRRKTKVLTDLPGNGFANGYCPHEEVHDWVCKECSKRVASFDSIFDDYQGRASKFLKVCYENQFLQDFLQEQIN